MPKDQPGKTKSEISPWEQGWVGAGTSTAYRKHTESRPRQSESKAWEAETMSEIARMLEMKNLNPKQQLWGRYVRAEKPLHPQNPELGHQLQDLGRARSGSICGVDPQGSAATTPWTLVGAGGTQPSYMQFMVIKCGLSAHLGVTARWFYHRDGPHEKAETTPARVP